MTVVSAVWLAATRCSASATRLRARAASPRSRASSSSWRTRARELVPDRSSDRSSRCCFASRDRQPGDPLELARAPRPWRAFSSSWSCASVRSRGRRAPARAGSSSVSFAARSPPRLASTRSSIFATCVAPALDLGLDLGAELDRLLARLDLRLAPDAPRPRARRVDAGAACALAAAAAQPRARSEQRSPMSAASAGDACRPALPRR